MVKKIKKIFEAAEKRVYGKDIPDDRDVVEQEGKLIIQKTTKAEADAMSEAFNKIFAEDTTIDGRQVLQNLDAMELPTDTVGSYLNAIKNKMPIPNMISKLRLVFLLSVKLEKKAATLLSFFFLSLFFPVFPAIIQKILTFIMT